MAAILSTNPHKKLNFLANKKNAHLHINIYDLIKPNLISLPATIKVAFRLLVFPNALLASHQYTPASDSFRLCATRRKNKFPAGSRTLWDRASCGAVLNICPSLYQVIVGSGSPTAWQFSVAGSCRATVVSTGCSVILGGC